MKKKLSGLALATLSLLACPNGACLGQAIPAPTVAQAADQRDYYGPKAVIFGAVVNVLQDIDFTVVTADVTSGFVTAESATVNKTNFFDILGNTAGSGSTRATVFIEELGDKRTRVRVKFIATKSTSSHLGQEARQDTQIDDPRLYQRLFARIDAAVLARMPSSADAASVHEVAPIALLGPSVTIANVVDAAEVFSRARGELEKEGFQVIKDDEVGKELITAPLNVHLTIEAVDCGKMFGISYIRDKRAITDVQYFVSAKNGNLTVRTAIDGVYHTGYGNPDKTLTCTSKGTIEAAFIENISTHALQR